MDDYVLKKSPISFKLDVDHILPHELSLFLFNMESGHYNIQNICIIKSKK